VALVTDGRMSGASGKVPAAIHVSPEALDGGPIGRIADGDVIRVDGDAGTLEVLTQGALDRPLATADLSDNQWGVGRDMFHAFRNTVGTADTGATIFGDF
ncbi:MAG: dihydroxy-acid dehydratase, partial [Pseudomonadota bacterium]